MINDVNASIWRVPPRHTSMQSKQQLMNGTTRIDGIATVPWIPMTMAYKQTLFTVNYYTWLTICKPAKMH